MLRSEGLYLLLYNTVYDLWRGSISAKFRKNSDSYISARHFVEVVRIWNFFDIKTCHMELEYYQNLKQLLSPSELMNS